MPLTTLSVAFPVLSRALISHGFCSSSIQGIVLKHPIHRRRVQCVRSLTDSLFHAQGYFMRETKLML